MEWVRDTFIRPIVKAIYGYFFGLFNNLFSSAAIELSTTPSNFASVGGSLVSLVTTIGSTVVLPIAAAILSYSFAKEIFELVSKHNNMADFDSFAFFKTLFKTAAAAWITTKCFDIVLGFFDMGAYLVESVAGSTPIIIDAESLTNALVAEPDIGQLCLYILLGLVIGLVVLICGALILITIWSRLINIYILVVISPIPFATLLGSQSLSSIGSGFIKNVLSTALQGFIIAVLMAIMASIISNTAANVNDMTDLLKVTILLITSTITISKSLSLAKTAVGLAG